MIISSGTRLGPYEIVAPIGAGGMGEVYRARDTRLDRMVAIKVLPAEFAANAQFKVRFEREAKTISQLNHPNICTLYDVGENYLVMELLEGETLAEKLTKGPLPLDQVLRFGIEIAEALEKAHRIGVVHRDLKPSNIMITKSGAKLLDFGLAKPTESGVLSALTSLRTEKRNLTEEGTIVGTFQYMAPEQIEGGEVDARTDIFAFGGVLYEMATGKHAFDGKSKASLIASILNASPQPISAMQPMTPPLFDRLVRTCLQKDSDDRWQSAHDVATELRWIAEAAPSKPAKVRNLLPWSVAAVLGVAAIALGIALWRDVSTRRKEAPVRTFIVPPEKTSFDFLYAAAPPAISPDGTKIVFGATEGKRRMLWIRSLGSVTAQRLAGTEGASYPFWSPDSRFIGFFADNALKKMEMSGGALVSLCNVTDGRGGSWSPDGRTIVFSGRYTAIRRISAAGGTPTEVTKLEQNYVTHRWPEFLPDSRHFLFLASATGSEDPTNTIYVGGIETKMQKPLITAAYDPHYLNGNIIFTRADHILMAQRFDPKRLAIVGEAVPLREQQVEASPNFTRNVVSIARDGTLVYQSGAGLSDTQLTWFDRSGKSVGVLGENAPYNTVAIAPDEKSVAVSYNRAQSNVWLFDLIRGIKTRATFGNGWDVGPLWSPDGRRLVYSSRAGGRFTLVLKDLTTGAEQELLSGQHELGSPGPTSWRSDGQAILYTSGGRTTYADIWWVSLSDRKPHLYVGTPFIETGAQFSPDGKWIAYESNESGLAEIYVAPFPPTGAKWQISTNGGRVPRWRSDGKELFYLFFSGSGDSFITAVSITLGTSPQIGQAVKLFQFHPGFVNQGMYDVTRDGQRFLINSRVGGESQPSPLIVVQHFDNELRAVMERHE